MPKDVTEEFMALALDMKARSTNQNFQSGAIITNGVAAHNIHITNVESPETTMHAEAQAICRSAAEGSPTSGFEIYTTSSPCVACAKLIIQSGITAVHYYEVNPSNKKGLELLHHAGVKVDGPLANR